MERNDVLSLAIDLVKGHVAGNYSAKEAESTLRQALVEMNGGSTKINIKTFNRGNELFALVEELIPSVIDEGLKSDNAIFNLVEYKNIAYGDENAFYVEGNAQFVVADSAAGIRGVRRQRLVGGETVSVKTTVKSIRVYENLGRLLAGRIDFDTFIAKVGEAFTQAILLDAYKAIASISENTTGLNSTYAVSGEFSEEDLLELIAHVEAATGKTASIYGTASALRKVSTAVISDEAKSDLYNLGFYGKFYGTDMVKLAQAHYAGTSDFVLDDSKLYIIAGDDKPIKVVNEGEGILHERNALENNDLTQEYFYAQAAGVAVICSEKMGVYTIA